MIKKKKGGEATFWLATGARHRLASALEGGENVGFVTPLNSGTAERMFCRKCLWPCSSHTHTQTKSSPSVWRTDVCTVNWHLSGAVSWGVVVGGGYLITAERLQASLWLSASIYVCLYVDCSFCSAQHLFSPCITAFPFSLSLSLSHTMSKVIFLCLNLDFVVHSKKTAALFKGSLVGYYKTIIIHFAMGTFSKNGPLKHSKHVM